MLTIATLHDMKVCTWLRMERVQEALLFLEARWTKLFIGNLTN